MACDYLVNEFLSLCKAVGCPINDEKTEWGCTRIIFLGILLDGVQLIMVVPEEKRTKSLNLLNWTLGQKTVTVKHLQALAGSLNFLCKAIVPGRMFICHIYDKFVTKSGEMLKNYHHIRIDSDIKADCEMWKKFLVVEQKSISRLAFY